MVGHKVFTMFSPEAKTAVRDAAKAYSEASETLRTESPKLAGANGASSPNPKYEAAQAAADKAEQTLKDAGLNPDEAAYAYKVSSEGVPKQEAQVSRPGVLEQQRIGEGYDQLRSEVEQRGVGAPKASPKLTDGPVAAVENGRVVRSNANRQLAQHVEAAITAPAPDWKTKWQQLQDARSTLLQAERDAMASTATNKTQVAKDMRTLADTVRAQQEKVATYVFGAQDGKAFMQRLNVLDTRYRNLMEAVGSPKAGETIGDALQRVASAKGAAGREVDKRFRAFAADDPQAIQAWDAMRGTGSNVEKDVRQLVAAEKIPFLGKAISFAKLAGGFNEWMRERTAGSPVKFADFLRNYAKEDSRTVQNIAGSAAQRAAVQGDVLNGVTQ